MPTNDRLVMFIRRNPSEFYIGAELDHPRTCGSPGRLSEAEALHAGDACAGGNGTPRRMVQNVQAFRLECETQALANRESFVQRNVHAEPVGSIQNRMVAILAGGALRSDGAVIGGAAGGDVFRIDEIRPGTTGMK